MLKDSSVSVVGGIPFPIGGVTNFVSRISYLPEVREILDLYPHKIKASVPDNCNLVQFKSVFGFLFWFSFASFSGSSRLVFFNFSTPRSLFLFLFMPKLKNKFFLMLHHGELEVGKFSIVYKYCLRKIDKIFVLSSCQQQFYESLSVEKERLIETKSYLLPTLDWSLICDSKKQRIDDFFASERVLVTSGYPTAIYNHDFCIEFVKKNPKYKLALFIYGEGEMLTALSKAAEAFSNIEIFINYNQHEFNYALKKSRAYLRPTSTDSFGVAVADAVALNVPVLASNVCERYPGAFIFTLRDYFSFENALNIMLGGGGEIAPGEPSDFIFKLEKLFE